MSFFGNSRIPYYVIPSLPCVIPRLDRGISSQNRYPWVKPEDDIVGNSRIPRINLEFLKDCFASLAMTKILEFLEIASAFSKPRNDENSRIHYRDPPVKLGDDTKSKVRG